MSKFTFSGIAKEIGRHVGDTLIIKEYGVWTDGIGLYADNDPPCAYLLKPGTKYKITIELDTELEE